MTTYTYETTSSVIDIEKVESVKSGSKLPNDKILLEYNLPVWVIKTGPPLFLTVTVESEPPFKAGATAKVIVEVIA